MTLHSCETKPLLDAIRDQWDSLLPPRIEILSPRPRLPGEVWKPSQYRATEGLNFSNQYRRKLWLLERQIFSTFLTKYLNIGPELLSIKINSRLWSILDTWARHSKQLFSLSSERSPSPPYGTKPFSWEAKIWSASDQMFNLSVWSFAIKWSYLIQNKLLTWCDQVFQHKSIMFLQRNHVEFVQLFKKTCWKKPPHLQNSGSIWSRELEGWEYLNRFFSSNKPSQDLFGF